MANPNRPPDAVPYQTSRRGSLFYYAPAVPPTDTPKPTQRFRPRRLGPGRILIAPVHDRFLESPRLAFTHPTRPHRSSTLDKLAVTRENAKRFIKSVISNSNSSSHPDGSQTTTTSHKRRSWSPVKRTTSGESAAAGVGAAAAAAAAATTAGGEAVTASIPPVAPVPLLSPEDMRVSNHRPSISAPVNGHLARPRLASGARNFSTASGGAPQVSNGQSPRMNASTGESMVPVMDLQDEKPIASGNGVSVAVRLAEPVLYLQGFDNADSQPGNTAMLRGSLHLKVQKSAKIKAVTLKFKGRAITKWPEGIPPRKTDFEEVDTIMSHTWPFFNAQFESAERGTNADRVQLHKGPESSVLSVPRVDALGRSSLNTSVTNLSAKEARKLSLQVNQSRSFGKGEAPPNGPGVAAKGYRTFLPGDYTYNFELPLDSRLPETIDVELGSVKYELEAEITRSGAFRANLAGSKEVVLIRAPSEGSLEQVEPIAISRNWEDQLHYDIVISGKSFPLGTQVPIAFKLTPLAKVQCHRIKVLVTENIEYFCSNKRVHRMEPTRKLQLFEKRADGPPTSTFPGSTMRVTAGGGIPYDARARAARGEEVTPADTTNLLGNLEGDTNIGPTEMEFSVQLPNCQGMKERERSQRLHFDTTYQNIQVHHWIKIVMRLSKPDTDGSGKRRHFEISIDSPFHILSCRATQANTSLPAYTSPQATQQGASLYECGCPGAARRRNSPTSFVPTLSSLETTNLSNTRTIDSTMQSPGLARPQQAHVHGPAGASRPIHMLRAPSFNPPAFDEEQPPPPLVTPPPMYGDIASPTEGHGLADYFARLGDTYDEDDDDHSGSHRSGRVNVPLTPGGRIHRSMDLGRAWVPVGQ